MNRIAVLAVLALPLVAGGCAQLNSARDWLVDPKTQQAASVLVSTAKAGATLVSCFVGSGSAIALAVEQQAGAKGQYATGIIYAASTKVCAALSGTADGTVTASGGEAVVTGTK